MHMANHNNITASLKTIGTIPELLYEILSYLTPQDTFSLLLTCKSFYPVCYKHLWTDLRLYRVHASEDGERCKLVCGMILKAIKNRGVGGSGLKYTRVLRLHRGSLGGGGGGFVRSGLCAEVIRLLDDGGLELEGVELSYFNDRIDNPNRPTQDGVTFLKKIREYSLKKGPEDFSLAVTTVHNAHAVMHLYTLPLQNITTLYLEMDWTITAPRRPYFDPPRTENFRFFENQGSYGAYEDGDGDDDGGNANPINDYDSGSWSDANGGPISNDQSQLDTQTAESLANLLNRTSSLKVLSISTVKEFYRRRYRSLHLIYHLITLKDTIKSLQRLQSLEIRGKFFHPSFFITPPESCKKVVYEGLFSHEWFRRFARCGFENVLYLRVRCRHNRQQTRRCEKEFAPNKVLIEDVRVCGLKRCELKGVERITEGLEEALLRRNTGLEDYSRRRLESIIAKRL
ncbi:hypothetical protein AOL_s00215g12 [Orbilia oligospora ATCC 24927]|uniref:F-box domain-containing protein n=1 Tax=Arthrobotrys oligospora (strain ATCC 24927 / CBS 115.81 / DSM 1491) TaxID=756982 RepID=G1XT83_ARTOA|nr:hypothetical protein AOL_s00215g12 [Orbilia oligospora ATCC 24927]EGX43276.1 hypothetical protein AOL_s00215g12 [Orbilia oligospora ATCC 24927]